MDEKPLGMRIGESVFCVGYLAFALVAGIMFLCRPASDSTGYAATCAAMTFLLGAGDAFHLVPRVITNIQGGTHNPKEARARRFWLGLGNLVSSITMTVFYVLFFDAMAAMPNMVGKAPGFVRTLLVVLAVARIVLCLSGRNRWFCDGGSNTWAIVRNVPFAAMGALTVAYLIACYHAWLPALLVALSFAFYLGVVLFAHKRPALGALMIPKTICYISLIAIFLGA